jgi:hypothetical protein
VPVCFNDLSVLKREKLLLTPKRTGVERWEKAKKEKIDESILSEYNLAPLCKKLESTVDKNQKKLRN